MKRVLLNIKQQGRLSGSRSCALFFSIYIVLMVYFFGATPIFGCVPLFESGKTGFDKENEVDVPIQYCVIQQLVDYLPLEDLKSFEIVNKAAHRYASQSDFYRFALVGEKTSNRTLREVFFSRFLDYDYALKTAYCYTFGFPSDLFIQREDASKYNPKRRYYSKIPSLDHLYTIVHLRGLYCTINQFDTFFHESYSNKVYFSLANAFYILKHQTHCSLEEQKQLFKDLTQEYSNSLQLFYKELDGFLMQTISNELERVNFDINVLQRYYITLVLALPRLLGISTPAYKNYLYKMILKLPFLYKRTAFIMLYEQYRKPNHQMDSVDNKYRKEIFVYFSELYRRTKKMGLFSSRFFSYYFSDLFASDQCKIDMTIQYVTSLLCSVTHPELEERVLLSLTSHIFKNEQIVIDSQQYEIFNDYAVRGLQLACLLHEQTIWFFYFRKILFLRHCLDTNQNKLPEDFIDVGFINTVLDRINGKYKTAYWRLWGECVKKYSAKSN